MAVRRQLLKLRIRGSAGAVSAMNVSPDGHYLITVSADRTPRVWNMKAGRQVSKLDALDGSVDALSFLPDGRSFVSGDRAGKVILWDLESGARVRAFGGHAGAVTALAVSADGTALITGGADRTVRVHGLATGRSITTIEAHAGAVSALHIGPTGQFIISGGDDGTVRIWERASGARVASFAAHQGAVTALRFGRDETEFYSAGDDGRVQFWHTDKPQPVRSYAGTTAPVRTLATDETFGRLVAGLADGSVIVWRTEEEAPETVLKAHAGPVNSAVFDVGGTRLVTAGGDAITKLWDLESGGLLVQLISTKGGWAAVDDDGRFDGSDAALNDVQWVTETQALSIDNFSADYYEPGLLHKKRLGTGNLISASARTLNDGILPPPVSRILLAEESAGEKLRITVETRDQGGGITETFLYHNGKVVDRENVIDEQRTTQNELAVVTTVYGVRPVAGDNRFNAVALSGERIRGMLAEASVEVSMAARPPRLHVLAVGINAYRDRRLALNYGVPDANAILDLLRAETKGVFSQVVVHRLLDSAATRDAIAQALDGLRESNPEDVVVIYMAGHGVAVGDEWYFVPFEFRLPFTRLRLERGGLASADLRKMITRIEARRTFLLIDTCQSGTAASVFEDYVDRRALRRLGRSVGMHVLAATAKDQLAAELKALGHGVFTYAVITGMGGGADTDPPDGNLTVQEIIRFSEQAVPRLSKQSANRQQWPLTFSRGFDFTIARRPPQ